MCHLPCAVINCRLAEQHVLRHGPVKFTYPFQTGEPYGLHHPVPVGENAAQTLGFPLAFYNEIDEMTKNLDHRHLPSQI